MCVDPVTLAIGATVLSTAVSAVGQLQAGASQDKIARHNANLELQRGEYESRQIQRRLRYTQGKAAVQAGANGVGLDGSFLDILADNAIQAEVDSINAKNNAANVASGMRAQGQSAKTSSRFSAVGAIIGGAARGYGIYNDAQARAGMLGAP